MDQYPYQNQGQNPYQNNQDQENNQAQNQNPDQPQNPYQTPNSNTMTQQQPQNVSLTIEEALSRGYDFDIGEVISEGWQATNGFKLKFFLAGLCMFGMIFVVTFFMAIVLAIMMTILPPGQFIVLFNIMTNIVQYSLYFVLIGGLIRMCLNQLRGEPVEVGQLFSVKHLWQPLIIAGFLVALFSALGFFLLLPGLYLAIAYGLVTWIIIDQPGVTFWKAMEGSRKLISQHWFKFLGLGLVLGVFNFAGMLVLGIGLLWTAPLSLLAMGVVYRKMFEA